MGGPSSMGSDFCLRGMGCWWFWAMVVGGWLIGSFVAGQASVRGWRLSFWAAGPSFGAAVSSFVVGVIVGVPHWPIVFEGDVSLSPVVL